MESNLEEKYNKLFGFIPETIQKRIKVANHVNQNASLEIIELYREEMIHKNPLEPKIQQLVHFALLIGANQKEAAVLHAKGALRSGATFEELYGVCKTAAVTGGMPAFSIGINILYDILEELENKKYEK